MKRILLFCLFAAAARAADAPDPPSAAKLRWNNGETIAGELVEASPAGVTWKTPLFENPLVVAWPALRSVEQAVAAIPAADPFLFTLRDGSSISADLVSITKDAIAIHSSRHGDAVLERSEVLAMRRLRGGSLLFAGPFGDAGWDTPPTGDSGGAGSLAVKPGGVLAMPVLEPGRFP